MSTPDTYESVVRVYATTQEWNYDSPWQAEPPESCTGSGLALGDGQVLTGAHVVANATFIQIQKVTDPHKAIAQVVAVWHDCDLALLQVEEPDFFDGVPVPELGDLPDLRDSVAVVGYPVGGEEISITEGVVSRIEVTEYSHSQRLLLAITIDAAINSGNSGGPVFKDDKVVGIAFQALDDAENIGEMVPAPILKRFLAGTARGVPPGIPGLGVLSQNLENPRHRADLGLPPRGDGVLVLSTQFGNSAWGVLEPGDVLLSVDGLPVAANGTVRYMGRYRTSFDVVLGDHFIGDELPLVILRGRERLQLNMPLLPLCPLVPRSAYDVRPRYFVYGGMVFQALTRNFLKAWSRWWEKAPKEFLHAYYSGDRSEAQQELVVVAKVLADAINVGYEELYNESVVAVNGAQPRTLDDLVAMIEASDGRVEIKTFKGVAVLDPNAVAVANERILKRYRISADRNLTP